MSLKVVVVVVVVIVKIVKVKIQSLKQGGAFSTCLYILKVR